MSEALLTLANEANYEQVNDTDITPEEAAAAAYTMYETWLQSECSAMTPPTMPLVNIYGHLLAASESAGNTANDTTYTRVFPSTLVLENGADKQVDNYTFDLPEGYWHVHVECQNRNGSQSIIEIVDCTGADMKIAYSIETSADMVVADAWLYHLGETRSIRIDQWFRAGSTAGRGLGDNVRGGYCALLRIEYSETKPGV